jgi:hypothetical protein
VEDQSAPIPEEIASELGRIMQYDEGRSMRAGECPVLLQLWVGVEE